LSTQLRPSSAHELVDRRVRHRVPEQDRHHEENKQHHVNLPSQPPGETYPTQKRGSGRSHATAPQGAGTAPHANSLTALDDPVQTFSPTLVYIS
jgi:hypothetical protein